MKKILLGKAILVCLVLLASCSNDEDPAQPPTPAPTPDGMDNLDLSETVIWTGASLTFSKDNNTDSTLPENQDRITENVWITRDDGGGQIYNIASETGAVSATSPAGTLWAIGTTEDLQNLTFDTFRGTLDKPKDNVNVDLVMLLEEDNIAIDIRITGWSSGRLGGFSYTRSTE